MAEDMKISGKITRKKEVPATATRKTFWVFSIGQTAGFTTFDAKIAAAINEGDTVDCAYFVIERDDAQYKNIKTMTKKATEIQHVKLEDVQPTSKPQEPFNPQFWGMVFKASVNCAIVNHEDGTEELTISHIEKWHNKLWALAQKLRAEAQR